MVVQRENEVKTKRRASPFLNLFGQAMATGKSYLLILSLFLCNLLQGSQPTSEENLKKERELLKGTWNLVSAKMDGGDPPEGLKQSMKWIRFDDDKLTYNYRINNEFISDTFQINPKTNPKEIDLNSDDKEGNKHRLCGIYKIEGNQLLLCLGDEKTRPKMFESKHGSGYQLYTHQREKKK